MSNPRYPEEFKIHAVNWPFFLLSDGCKNHRARAKARKRIIKQALGVAGPKTKGPQRLPKPQK